MFNIESPDLTDPHNIREQNDGKLPLHVYRLMFWHDGEHPGECWAGVFTTKELALTRWREWMLKGYGDDEPEEIIEMTREVDAALPVLRDTGSVTWSGDSQFATLEPIDIWGSDWHERSI